MDLTCYYLKRTYATLIERYYNKKSYRTIADFRTALLREYGCEYVRLREIPGARRLDAWEIKVHGRIYFYNYDHKSFNLKFVGVR